MTNKSRLEEIEKLTHYDGGIWLDHFSSEDLIWLINRVKTLELVLEEISKTDISENMNESEHHSWHIWWRNKTKELARRALADKGE